MGAGGDEVVTVRPTDDVGADTLDRFRFQAHLVVERCVALLVDDRVQSVICEWHEDYVVQFANGRSELVSVKHHDGTQPHWSVKDLCLAGGLKHLLERFVLLNESCTCRLQTNEQLRTGKGNCAELREACAGNDDSLRADWAKTIAPHLGTTDVALVIRFLKSLRIEDGLPDRRLIEKVHLQELMPKVAESFGLVGAALRSAYEALHRLAMDASSSPGYAVVMETLCDPGTLGSDGQRARVLAGKTIDRERALTAIGRGRGSSPLLLAASVDVSPARTVLVKKLEAGGMGATGVNSARRLKANWDLHRQNWSSGLPGDEEVVEHLRAEILQLAGRAEMRTREAGAPYASAMYLELERLLDQAPPSTQGVGPLNTALLLGLAFERTEACEIFWSDRFDPGEMP